MDINPYLVLLFLALVVLTALAWGVRLVLKRPGSAREPAAAPPALRFTASDYYAGTLRQAAELAGGEAELAVVLQVSPEDLGRWLRGEGAPPVEVHLAALELITGGADRAKADKAGKTK